MSLTQGIVAAAVAVPALALAGFATWLGAFKKVDISVKEVEEQDVLFTHWQGCINDIGKAFEEKMPLLLAHPLLADREKSIKSFGIYFDDPYGLKDASKLRVAIGVILPKDLNAEQVKEIKEFYTEKGIESKTFSKGKFVFWEFPFKNTLSFAVGAFKFYPASETFCNENKLIDYEKRPMGPQSGASMEVYDMYEGKTVSFYFPLDTWKEFMISPYPLPEYKEGHSMAAVKEKF